MTHPAPRPNIILLVGEDAGRAAGCYGDTDALTPHLDRLAAEGCLFGRAFSTAPVCAPSRSALVTGRPAWTIGSHHMRSKLLAPPPALHPRPSRRWLPRALAHQDRFQLHPAR